MSNIVKKYLEITNFSNSKKEFETLFLSHPNYPSIHAISDSLNFLFVENAVLKFSKTQLRELPSVFITSYCNELVLVIKTDVFIKIETENGNKKDLQLHEFLLEWDGVILVIEPNEIVVKEMPNKKFRWIQYTIPFVFLLSISIYFYGIQFINASLLITSIIGFIIGLFIVQEKWGVKNRLIIKLCNLLAYTSCDSVITSNQNKINNWISFSDLPIVFFAVNTISLILYPNVSSVIGILTFFALPIVLYSIWIQKIKLKKWCPLCLLISSIILIQSLLVAFFEAVHFDNFGSNVFFYLFSMILISSLWFWVKPILEDKYELVKNNTELIKFKRDYTVFNFLSKDLPVINKFNFLKGINFGNIFAPIKLTLILSPSSIYCHKAFEEAYTLLKNYSDKISLHIIFNINPSNNNNPYKIVVERLLTLNYADKAKEAIIDWHIHKIGLESWIQKWGNQIDLNATQEMLYQYEWCSANELNFTPTKIINSKIFPEDYEIPDVKYFINDLVKESILKENEELLIAQNH
jgi:hypothetical protein